MTDEQTLLDIKARLDEARDAFDNGDCQEGCSPHIAVLIRGVVRWLDRLEQALAEEGVECSI